MIVNWIDLGFVAALGVIVGVFGYSIWLRRDARQSTICPVCLGPLTEDKATSEAWGQQIRPVEGTVLVDPDDEGSGFVTLDDGRIGRVDVVPAEAMLIGETVETFSPDEEGST